MTEYEWLVILAEELNMRKAAARLYVSPSALSQRLQTLENDWNTKIFVRTPRGLILTPAGERIVQLAKEIVQATEQVKEEVEQMDGRASGTLRLAVVSIAAQHWLPSILKRFTERYPNVKIALVTGWTSNIMEWMYQNDFHIGIVRGVPHWNGIKHFLFADRLYLIDQKINGLEQLPKTDRPFIQFKSDSTYFLHIQQWWHEQFETPPERTMVVDQIETCKQLAYHGIGYAILPEIALHDLDDSMNKIPLKDRTGRLMERGTWLIGADTAWQLPQVQAFYQVVRELMD
ncbi:LysR family transcriptional regulator [Anoxybacillus rupiensis]|jgi:DNA-binding transcriptional LysR family regulator|uniref:LysR family transcriptional regulator n=1 Tax=Anoxybacteroides rupiense TaxID=311460 RepID=A0ABT5W8M1_9BACL|nr:MULTISPECIES: LysR family transcriptional regulator [Anoxybacillus]KXG10381.1 HTH-type transcriptional activator CmpR [Anoxybacillus sp. P3H1B]MBS2770682.1 LysR family transcriptional regulator [Anoxybacillus rupiensis]MDE8565672.1 LysR family transcriptional regulator [Anoxybacillus rupiensis]QHC03527.1 LysR family transcriptional regulator [Anoxybacillus sp. PDR2]